MRALKEVILRINGMDGMMTETLHTRNLNMLGN